MRDGLGADSETSNVALGSPKLQSFDMNVDAELSWLTGDTLTQKNWLSTTGKISIPTDSLIDHFYYNVELSDGIDSEKFAGTLYVNDLPTILSKPEGYTELGTIFKYTPITIDENKEKPFHPQNLDL